MGASLWLVVTADVIRSRRLTPRAEAQERILTALAAFNQSPVFGVDRSHLGTNFTLGRGDEIQGVLVATAPLLPILRHLRHALQPARLRIGVGPGYGAVGFVPAAKSIARFRDLEDRQFAEYYLIGTLLSLTLATTGYLACQLLANALPLG